MLLICACKSGTSKNCRERKEKVHLHCHEESEVNSAQLLSSRCRQRLKGTRGWCREGTRDCMHTDFTFRAKRAELHEASRFVCTACSMEARGEAMSSTSTELSVCNTSSRRAGLGAFGGGRAREHKSKRAQVPQHKGRCAMSSSGCSNAIKMRQVRHTCRPHQSSTPNQTGPGHQSVHHASYHHSPSMRPLG